MCIPSLPVHMSRRIAIPPPSTSTHIVQSYQLASNGLVAPNGVKLISE
ncbi:hypothetical protein PROFUN_05760 [Planoprotostelium fungivorum]|uniref:Uncharacterized protein n=1 Tax=Planoprotostelium fungivorum TaxID=1890364 RepID=A0A2P6NPW2_9EUKA|nr:hypothetical protein PROFUN_05760 [Planoprotostelium fungivorum]